MRFRRLILAGAVQFAMCGWAEARDIYVNNVTGDDSRGPQVVETTGSLQSPFRTIGRAIRSAVKADRIIIANTGEPYRESITLQGGHNSGVEAAPFEVIGNGAVLDGTEPVPAQSWQHFEADIFRFQPPRMHYQILYLDDKPATRVAVTAKDRKPPKLGPLEWCLFRGYIYFRTADGHLPDDYRLSYAGMQTGITLYEVRHIAITNLVVQGFQLDGINAHDGVTDAVLVGLTSRGNGRAGITVAGASRVIIDSCLVGNNGSAQVLTEGFSHTQILNCDLLDNTAPTIVRDGGSVEIKQ